MDTTDVLIFCEMSFKYFDYAGKNRRPSPGEIGRKLGLDERTVRLRTKKMEREGFIQYYQTIPNLRLFDRPLAYLCNFHAADLRAKKHALDLLQEAKSIIDIADFLGESFGVTISAASNQDVEEKAGEFAELIGISQFLLTPPRSFPPLHKSLDKLDWQLVNALRYDALKPAEEVANQLGITRRMTDYAVGKLFQSQSISTRAIINARDPQGIIFYSLNLSLNPQKQDQTIRELREAYGERLWWSFTPPGPSASLFLFATFIGRAEDDLLEALARPGVRGGSVTIFKGWVEPKRPSWLDKMIEERIARESPLTHKVGSRL